MEARKSEHAEKVWQFLVRNLLSSVNAELRMQKGRPVEVCVSRLFSDADAPGNFQHCFIRFNSGVGTEGHPADGVGVRDFVAGETKHTGVLQLNREGCLCKRLFVFCFYIHF